MTSWYSHVNITHLQKVANQIRGEAIQLSHSTQTPHRDSLLACIDMLVVLIGLYYQLSLKPVESKSQLGSYSSKCNTLLYVTLAYQDFPLNLFHQMSIIYLSKRMLN